MHFFLSANTGQRGQAIGEAVKRNHKENIEKLFLLRNKLKSYKKEHFRVLSNRTCAFEVGLPKEAGQLSATTQCDTKSENF